jgi:hypothetical protein
MIPTCKARVSHQVLKERRWFTKAMNVEQRSGRSFCLEPAQVGLTVVIVDDGESSLVARGKFDPGRHLSCLLKSQQLSAGCFPSEKLHAASFNLDLHSILKSLNTTVPCKDMFCILISSRLTEYRRTHSPPRHQEADTPKH